MKRTQDTICRAEQRAMQGRTCSARLYTTPQTNVSQPERPDRPTGGQATAVPPHVGAIRWCHHGTISHQRVCAKPCDVTGAQSVPTRWHSDKQGLAEDFGSRFTHVACRQKCRRIAAFLWHMSESQVISSFLSPVENNPVFREGKIEREGERGRAPSPAGN